MNRNQYKTLCNDINNACKDIHPAYLRNYTSNTLQVRATKILQLQKTKDTKWLICIDFEPYLGNASFMPNAEGKSGYYFVWLEPIDSDRSQYLIDDEVVIGYLDE